MKIFTICSKAFYDRIPAIEEQLERAGHSVTLPMSFDDPTREAQHRNAGQAAHAQWKAEMMRQQTKKVESNDAVLVLNFEKNGVPNYIGGATFLEIYEAWKLDKQIYFYNPLPDGILRDELNGMNPIIINGDLSLIKETKQDDQAG